MRGWAEVTLCPREGEIRPSRSDLLVLGVIFLPARPDQGTPARPACPLLLTPHKPRSGLGPARGVAATGGAQAHGKPALFRTEGSGSAEQGLEEQGRGPTLPRGSLPSPARAELSHVLAFALRRAPSLGPWEEAGEQAISL